MSFYISCSFFEEVKVDKPLACWAGEGAESPTGNAELSEPLIAEVFYGLLLSVELAEIVDDGDQIDYCFGRKAWYGGGADVFDGLQIVF